MKHSRFVQILVATKRFLFLSLILLGTAPAVQGQSYYVHRPDPRVSEHGSYGVSLHLAPNGGLLLGLGVGFFNRFQIGLSYGGENIIGSGPIDWYDLPPGVRVKVAIVDEHATPLSLAIGFDSQDAVGSVDVNQAGFYLAAGKKFHLGWITFDPGLGAGYDILDEEAFHLYVATGVIFADVFHFIPELTVYPQRDGTPEQGKVLNVGLAVKWSIVEGMSAEFLLADIITGLTEEDAGWTRSLRFQLTQEF